jgi:hypothetical protein
MGQRPRYAPHYAFRDDVDPTGGMSAEEREEYQRDVELAWDLLHGIQEDDKNGLPTFKFLSATTKPTEKEGRAALRRVLQRENISAAILEHITNLFDPRYAELNPRKVVFQKHDQGHANPDRDERIRELVFDVLHDFPDGPNGFPIRNKTKITKAYEIVAKRVGVSPDQIKRIYRRTTNNRSLTPV